MPHSHPASLPESSPASRIARSRSRTPFAPYVRASPTEQRLGASERLFVSMRRFTPTNVMRIITVEGHLEPESIERALRELEHRHPMLRATVVDGPEPRFVYDSALPVRLHVSPLRDEAHAHTIVEGLLRTPIRQAPNSLFEVHFLQGERGSSSELILLGDHALCDGISMNALAAELVGLCAGDAPRAPRRTLPVLEKLVPRFTFRDQVASFSAALARFVRIAALRAIHEPRSPARGSSYEFLELDRDDTRAIVERAREEGTTISGALMSAAVQAIRHERKTSPRLAVSVPVNLRPRIPGWSLEPDDLGNYTNATYLESAAQGEFWDDARELKDQLDGALAKEGLLASFLLVFRVSRPLLHADRVPFAHAMLSNSGVVPMKVEHGAFRVRSFRSATSAPMLSADHAFFCNTFDGRLTINLVFAEEVVSRDEAIRTLVRIARLLVEASS